MLNFSPSAQPNSQSTHSQTNPFCFGKLANRSESSEIENLREIKDYFKTLITQKLNEDIRDKSNIIEKKLASDTNQQSDGIQILIFLVSNSFRSVISQFKTMLNHQTKSIILDHGIEVLAPAMLRSVNQKQSQLTTTFQNKDKISPPKNSASFLDYGDSVVEEPSSNIYNTDEKNRMKRKQECDTLQFDSACRGEKNIQGVFPIKFEKSCHNYLEKQEKSHLIGRQDQKIEKKQQPEKNEFPIDKPSLQNPPSNPCTQTIKDTDWFKQLLTLTNAQTELTYLCQHLDWSLKLIQGNAEVGINMFSSQAEVKVIKSQNFVRYQGKCVATKSKKEARHHSSIQCLAELYSNVEGLWQTYRKLKEQNFSLRQPYNSNNSSILQIWLKKRNGNSEKMIKLQEEQKLTYKSDVEQYVENLRSCKKELCYFIDQNNQIFMNPRWIIKKPNSLGFWETEGYVRYEIKEKIYEFRHKNTGKSRKQSEENVTKDLLKKIYTDFPSLFKKFKKIKAERALF